MLAKVRQAFSGSVIFQYVVYLVGVAFLTGALLIRMIRPDLVHIRTQTAAFFAGLVQTAGDTNGFGMRAIEPLLPLVKFWHMEVWLTDEEGNIVASSGGPMVTELNRAHATHVTLPLASKNPVVMFKNIARLAELIVREKVDIVHARSRAPAWSAFRAAKAEFEQTIERFNLAAARADKAAVLASDVAGR